MSSANAWLAASLMPVCRRTASMPPRSTPGCCPGSIQDRRCWVRQTKTASASIASASYPEDTEEGELELASGTDFAQRLFFGQPRSDVENGLWFFDGMPHRTIVLDRLRTPPATGHLTGETRKGGRRHQCPVRPDARRHDHVPHPGDHAAGHSRSPSEPSGKKSGRRNPGVGAGAQGRATGTRSDRQFAQALPRFAGVLPARPRLADLDMRGLQLGNVLLNAGLQPVREEDEVAPLNSYLRWLPCVYDPGKDKRQWYTQLMFAQHAANLAPVWGRSQEQAIPASPSSIAAAALSPSIR